MENIWDIYIEINLVNDAEMTELLTLSIYVTSGLVLSTFNSQH